MFDTINIDAEIQQLERRLTDHDAERIKLQAKLRERKAYRANLRPETQKAPADPR